MRLRRYDAISHALRPNYFGTAPGIGDGKMEPLNSTIPGNHRTIVDLLEAKNISWGAYMDGMPCSGYLGESYLVEEGREKSYSIKHK